MDDTQSIASSGALAKCAHDGCTCTVETGAQYCSDYCLEQASTEHASADHECQCGHAECEHVTAVPGAVT